MLASGSKVGSKYVVVRELAHGGFGHVYVGRDTELDREVAIKVLRPEYSSSSQHVQRFLQEARAAARITHPGIVTVFECGTSAETVYIAMELLVGETLEARVRRAGKVPPGDAIELCRQLAAALEAAHGAGIVHRDLKPPNIFLVPDTTTVGGVRVKVLDFGIAKLAGSKIEQTRASKIIGTPAYMSPEQCKSGQKIDHRTDVYSLGCIVFEMLTGKPPFVGDPYDVAVMHQFTAPPKIRETVTTVPRMLDALVEQMLAKSADDRPLTMGAVLDELASWGQERYSEIATSPLVSSSEPVDRSAQTSIIGEPTFVEHEPDQPTATGSITITEVDVPGDIGSPTTAPLKPPSATPSMAMPSVVAAPSLVGGPLPDVERLTADEQVPTANTANTASTVQAAPAYSAALAMTPAQDPPKPLADGTGLVLMVPPGAMPQSTELDPVIPPPVYPLAASLDPAYATKPTTSKTGRTILYVILGLVVAAITTLITTLAIRAR
ncbi:MAG TPA: protein kinase [Kofleriaceae bacterium]|nr:protein kinase [Kofleriaceae bacterium]